ncbi:hypothetical protein Tco_0911527 [Tanacetum coccineum]|uniref:Uncharacterized protein n=1 Tax=Tanacetum coccineum TaxID=301880 RepID=A0ABQ5CXN0_9ASTR
MRCFTIMETGLDQPPIHIMQMFYCIVDNVHVDYAPLLWEGLHYQLMHPTTNVAYPRFTKIIVDHILAMHPDIPKRTNEPYHIVENDEVLKSIFNSRKTKGRGMRIHDWLLIEEIKTHSAPRPPKPQEQQAEHIDIENLDEATRVSIATAKSIEECKAQQNIKRVKEHELDEDIKKLVEGEESDANKFADDMIQSQEDPDTRIDLGSYKESLEVKKVVEYVSVDEEVEEETAEAPLIRRKGKGSLEINDTPLATPTRSPRTITDSLSSDKEKLQELMVSKPTSSKGSSSQSTSRFKHINGKFKETLKEVVPKMINETTNQNMKDNLPMVVIEGIGLEREKTKANIASMVANVVRKEQECTRVELSLQVSNDVATNVPPQFKKPTSHVDPCRVDAFCRQDHEDHRDDDGLPKGESSAKRQRTSEKRTYTRGESSSKDCRRESQDHEDHRDDDALPKGESSAKRQRTYEKRTYTRGTYAEEVPSEEVSPKLLAKMSRNGIKWVPIADDQK